MTKRLSSVEGRTTRMTTGKEKLDEMLEVGRPDGVKTGLGRAGGSHTTGIGYTRDSHTKQSTSGAQKYEKLEGVSMKGNMTSTGKRKLIKKYEPRRPPIMCGYSLMIGHVWH